MAKKHTTRTTRKTSAALRRPKGTTKRNPPKKPFTVKQVETRVLEMMTDRLRSKRLLRDG